MVLAIANPRKAPSTHLLHRRPCLRVSYRTNLVRKRPFLSNSNCFPRKPEAGSRSSLSDRDSMRPLLRLPVGNTGRSSLGCPNSTALVACSSGILFSTFAIGISVMHRTATTVPATINRTPHDLLAAPATRQTGPAPAPTKPGRWSSPVPAPTAATRRTQRRTLRSPPESIMHAAPNGSRAGTRTLPSSNTAADGSNARKASRKGLRVPKEAAQALNPEFSRNLNDAK
jgi:hypothetical protein